MGNIKASAGLRCQSFKTDHEVTEFLFSLEKKGIFFSLNSTREALQILKNPHLKYPSILVAGTNGKGSTVAMLTHILMAAGYRVGTYTSPHLLDVRERMMLNGRMISKPDFRMGVNFLRKKVGGMKRELSFFEFMTTMALWYFKRKKVDIAVVEVGLGGRWDATNVLVPEISIITSIDYDHQRLLGNRLSQIAFEKAGIIKNNSILVSGVHQPKIRSQYRKICAERNAKSYFLGSDFYTSLGTGSFCYRDWSWKLNDIELSLRGRWHQYQNAACVLASLHLLRQKGWSIDFRAIRTGLAHTQWPGRLEVVRLSPQVVLDGAHNVAGIRALLHALKGDFSYDKLHIVSGVMADKNYKSMFRKLLPIADTFTFVEPNVKRALTQHSLFSDWPTLRHMIRCEKDISTALPKILSEAGKKDMICVTGSLYTVAEAKKYFL